MAFVVIFALSLLAENQNYEEYANFFEEINWHDSDGNIPLFYAGPYVSYML